MAAAIQGDQSSTQTDDGGVLPVGTTPGADDAGTPDDPSPVSPPAPPAHDAAPAPVVDPVVPGTPVSNPQNAFTGATAYKSDPPTITANAQHGGTIVTGKPCLACHDGTTCVKFDFAGTVWQAPALTTGAPDVEVRIIDANNLAHDVHSDGDGNFWHRADADLALPAFSGVRTASWKAIPSRTATATRCSPCSRRARVARATRSFTRAIRARRS